MSALPEVLPILPFTRPVRGEVTLPGSKSITNRALLLAALCDSPVKITGALFSEDTELMATALNALGIEVTANAAAGTMNVSGKGGNLPSNAADLNVGNAGTAARFLTALCASAKKGVYRIDGVPQMRKRPMKGLIDALRSLGADIRCTGIEGFFPLEIQARGLQGGKVSIDASESSQLLSALLMTAPLNALSVGVILTSNVRWSFIEMTLRLMADFGVLVDRPADKSRFPIKPARYVSPGTFPIEPDASAASYFQALAVVVGGSLGLPGLRSPSESLQGDSAFAEVVHRARANPPGVGRTENFFEISDTFLTLAAIAPLLDGPTRITGIAHTRRQETDRVSGMARELRKLGQDVVEEDDSLTITPRPLKPGAEIETYRDHRFAMSFGILGCHDLHGNGRPWLSIKDPACCAKTFPSFFELLESLREKSLVS